MASSVKARRAIGAASSKVNATSLWLIEASRPVISTTVGDWTRLFRDPLPIGRLAVDTPESIAEQSKALLSDPEMAEAYGQNGRERAVNKFAWKLVTEKLYQFYEERITAEAARNNA